jgi:hypothetical protein
MLKLVSSISFHRVGNLSLEVPTSLVLGEAFATGRDKILFVRMN